MKVMTMTRSAFLNRWVLLTALAVAIPLAACGEPVDIQPLPDVDLDAGGDAGDTEDPDGGDADGGEDADGGDDTDGEDPINDLCAEVTCEEGEICVEGDCVPEPDE